MLEDWQTFAAIAHDADLAAAMKSNEPYRLACLRLRTQT